MEIDITNSEQILELYLDFFRKIKMYDDWTDEQIMLSTNDDDFEYFLQFIYDTLQSKYFDDMWFHKPYHKSVELKENGGN